MQQQQPQQQQRPAARPVARWVRSRTRLAKQGVAGKGGCCSSDSSVGSSNRSSCSSKLGLVACAAKSPALAREPELGAAAAPAATAAAAASQLRTSSSRSSVCVPPVLGPLQVSDDLEWPPEQVEPWLFHGTPRPQRQRAKAAASQSSEQKRSSNYHAVVEVGSFPAYHDQFVLIAKNARWASPPSQEGDVRWTRPPQYTFGTAKA